MGTSLDYPNVEQWQPGRSYSPPARVRHNGNIFDLVFGQDETYEPGVGDPDQNGWRFYDELYDQTPHTRSAQAKIIAYIPTWRRREGFQYNNDVIYQYITHGVIAFLMFSETNIGEFEPRSLEDVNAVLSDVVTTGQRHGVRILIALGGATDFGFLDLMTSIGNDPGNPLLDRVVQNVVSFVNSQGLDGVDLDLECWWGRPGENDQGGRLRSEGPHPAGYALTLFAQRLKQAMPDKLVSAAVFGTSWYGNNYDPRIADYVEWVGVMTYDLTGSWNDSPVGPHTALFKIRNLDAYVAEQQGEWPGRGMADNPILSVEDCLWYWTNPSFMNWQGPGQNIPRNKIAAGVPIYGYDFAYGKDPDDLSGQVPPGYRSMRYRDILGQFLDAHTAQGANIKRAGSASRPPFVHASGEYPYTNNIYFETPTTASTKLLFLMNVEAQGVIIWELSNDVWDENRSIIRELYRNSGNPSVRPPVHSGPTIALPYEDSTFTRISGGQQIQMNVLDITVTRGGQSLAGRVITIPEYSATSRYYFDGDVGYLDLIEVRAESGRGIGVSDIMMNSLANDALARGKSVIRINNANPEVLGFYRRMGFNYRPNLADPLAQERINQLAENGQYNSIQELANANWNVLPGEWEATPSQILENSSRGIARNWQISGQPTSTLGQPPGAEPVPEPTPGPSRPPEEPQEPPIEPPPPLPAPAEVRQR